MKLENQVTNLEISKRLKELGIPQCSYFKWTDWHNGVLNFGQPSENFRGEWHVVTTPVWLDETVVSAFTCAELGEMLPEEAATFSYREECYKSWMCKLHVKGDWSRYRKLTEASSMADAMGKMLIYLIENGLCPSPSKT